MTKRNPNQAQRTEKLGKPSYTNLAGLDHDISNLTSLLCFVGCKQGDGQTLLTWHSSKTLCDTMHAILTPARGYHGCQGGGLFEY